MAMAMIRPMIAPTSVLVACVPGGGGLAHQEQRGLDALADDGREGQDREAEDAPLHQRAVDAGLQLCP